jgi:hypothetical protein
MSINPVVPGECPACEGTGHDMDAPCLICAGSGRVLKHDTGKARMDLLDPVAIEQLARVLGFGAQKYGPHNWRQGIQQSSLLAAALRHLFAHLGGEDADPESGLPHVAHAMCSLMFLLGLRDRPDLDDRPVAGCRS